MGWWGHLNTTYCNQTCLNFLHSEVVGTQNPSFQLPLYPAVMPWVVGYLNYACSNQSCP